MQKTTLQTLLPTAGICNLQPDIVCPDNQLTDCINLTYNDDALRPIQRNAPLKELASQLLLVHETETTKQYICLGKSKVPPSSSTGTTPPTDTPGEDTPDEDTPDNPEINPVSKTIDVYAWIDDEGYIQVRLMCTPQTVTEELIFFIDTDYKGNDTLPFAWVTINKGTTSGKSVPTYIGKITSCVLWDDSQSSVYTFVPILNEAPPSGARPVNPQLSEGEYITLFYSPDNDNKPNFIRSFDSDILAVNAIGNTLIVNTANDMHYFLWKYGSYKYLGTRIPQPVFTPSLSYKKLEHNSIARTEFLFEDSGDGYSFIQFTHVDSSKVDDFENTVIGTYSHNLKTAEEEYAGFTDPFFVCCAVELYDGSYTLISQPVLMWASIDDNTTFIVNNKHLTAVTATSTLYCTLSNYTQYKEFSDIVRGVSVFATPQIRLYHTKLRDKARTVSTMGTIAIHYSGHRLQDHEYMNLHANSYKSITLDDLDGVFAKSSSFYDLLEKKSFDEFKEELVHSSQFYHIGDFDSISFTPDKAKVKNLTVQRHIEKVDFFSHCDIIANDAQTFNRRLNLYSVKRSFFNGFSQFSNAYAKYTDLTTHSYITEVTIETPSGVRVVINRILSSFEIFYDGMWFYYPDPRAKHVRIFNPDVSPMAMILDADLKEHTGLNGAYYFGSKPTKDTTVPSAPGTVLLDSLTAIDHPEPLPNYLLQSEVDNPFSFTASGYVRVGQGTIIGMAGLTTALSQDAYKVATTIVFTTQGIWALSINSEGQYSSVAPPFSREVCSNPDSITMIDQGVFFVSKKGLMLITDNGIRCVSEQLNGKVPSDQVASDFQDFLHDCRLAYDYRASLLWLINNRYTHHWCYNIKSGTFSRINDGNQYIGITNFYPDTLLQSTDFSVFSLLNRPNINQDPDKYQCSFTTRPIKFGAALRMKTITQMVHLRDLPDNSLSVTIEASNNLKDWTTLHSLHGRGYKYYRLTYDFKDISAYHTYSGSVLSIKESETNKLR